MREEFGKGDEFCQKITYRVTGKKPEDLISIIYAYKGERLRHGKQTAIIPDLV